MSNLDQQKFPDPSKEVGDGQKMIELKPKVGKKLLQGLWWGVLLLGILITGGVVGLLLSSQSADIRQSAHYDENRGRDCQIEVSEGFNEDGRYWYSIKPKDGAEPFAHSNLFVCSGQENDDGTVHCDDQSAFGGVSRFLTSSRPINNEEGVIKPTAEVNGTLDVPCGGEVQIDFWWHEGPDSEYEWCGQWLHSFAPKCTVEPTDTPIPTEPVPTETPVPVVTPTITPTVTVTPPTITPTGTIVPVTTTPTPIGPTSTVTTTPNPTSTPNQVTALNCDDECVSNADCSNSTHICFTTSDGKNRCRLQSNLTDSNCQPSQVVVQTQPELPVELPSTGPEDWINWLKVGLATLGVGAALLLLL